MKRRFFTITFKDRYKRNPVTVHVNETNVYSAVQKACQKYDVERLINY